MAIETLRPNAAGTYTELGVYPADPATHYDKVDEATPDENDTYVRNTISTGTYQRDTYNLPAHSGSGIINSVIVYSRLLRWAQRIFYKIDIYTHSTLHESPEVELTNFMSFETKNYQWTTNPDTGLAWTWDEIDALEAGIALRGDNYNGDQGRCTQVYVEVDYSEEAILVSKTHQSIWNVRSLFDKTIQFKWNVARLLDLVSKTLMFQWNVRAFVSDTLRVVFSIRSLVNKTNQYIWNVRSLVNDTFQSIWHVRELVNDTVNFKWNVWALISKTNQFKWDVLALIDKNLQTIWNVRSLVDKTIQLKWHILDFVSDTLQVIFNVRSLVNKTNQYIWSVLVELPRLGYGSKFTNSTDSLKLETSEDETVFLPGIDGLEFSNIEGNTIFGEV